MKSTKTGADVVTEVKTYPWLGHWNIDSSGGGEFVVLFTSPNNGTVIWSDERSKWRQGVHSQSWMEETFIPFTGKIVLEN